MVSKLQITRGKWHAGLTEQNHLANAFLTEPVLLSESLSYVFGVMYKNPLNLLTSGLGKVKFLDNRQFQWRMMGDSEKAIAIKANLLASCPYPTQPGLNGTLFQVVIGEKWFGNRDVLVTNDGTLLQVKEEPYQLATNEWVYTLRLTGSNNDEFVDPAQLAAGMELSKEFTALSEFDEGGHTTYATPFELRNQLTTLAKAYSITRSAATDVMVMSLPNPNGKGVTNLWTQYMEWNALCQWYREQERALMYSRYNVNSNNEVLNMSGNGRPVYMGAGIREQIESGHRREYTVLTESIIREFLMDLSYNRKDMSDRKFVALTGEYGMDAFDRAMKDAMKSYNVVDTKFITGSGKELTFGSQFKTYKGLNGTELTLMHFPLYDDVVRHRELHPVTKRPLESYRFTVLDFGTVNGQPNIQKVAKRDSEMIMWHTGGSITPTGVAKSVSTMRSNAHDGYAVHMLAEIGVQIANPISCGELICVAN